jgi:hypothetical protein
MRPPALLFRPTWRSVGLGGCLQEDNDVIKTWKKTMKVAVTGAAGQISNHLLFMVSLQEVQLPVSYPTQRVLR